MFGFEDSHLGGNQNLTSTHELFVFEEVQLSTVHQPEHSVQFSSVAQSCPTFCDPMDRSTPGLPVHPTPRVHSNLCALSWWCHPAISSSVIPFFSCPQSLPASGCFPMSQLFTWSSQSIGVSASASVLPMNIQDWFPLEWTGWISRESSPSPQFKSINSSALSCLHSPTLTSIHDHWKSHSHD